MKITTTLRKIMDKQFRPALQRVMEKWTEASDVHAMVKIAKAVDAEGKDYFESIKKLTEDHGFQLEGRKSVNGDEITDALLQEFGKFRPDGQMTIAGCTDEQTEGFMAKKKSADEAIRKFNNAHEQMISEDIELEIPRLVKVTDKLIRKEVITAYDCFLLEPFLDLSGVSDLPKDDSKE